MPPKSAGRGGKAAAARRASQDGTAAAASTTPTRAKRATRATRGRAKAAAAKEASSSRSSPPPDVADQDPVAEGSPGVKQPEMDGSPVSPDATFAEADAAAVAAASGALPEAVEDPSSSKLPGEEDEVAEAQGPMNGGGEVAPAAEGTSPTTAAVLVSGPAPMSLPLGAAAGEGVESSAVAGGGGSASPAGDAAEGAGQEEDDAAAPKIGEGAAAGADHSSNNNHSLEINDAPSAPAAADDPMDTGDAAAGDGRANATAAAPAAGEGENGDAPAYETEKSKSTPADVASPGGGSGSASAPGVKSRWSPDVGAAAVPAPAPAKAVDGVSVAEAAAAAAIAASKSLVLTAENLDVQRAADFMLAVKGNSYKGARVFVESVLASIDRKERLEQEGLKRSHAAAGSGKDVSASGDSNKRHRTDPKDASGAGGAGGERGARGRSGGVRQRERDERKRDRADSRDSRDASTSGRSTGGGRDPKSRGVGGKEGGRGSGGKDSFAGGAGGPPFRDLENWDPEKALIRSLFLTDELDKHAITVVLLIPNEKRVVGIVVGRHGLRLKTILSTSKCTITVENDKFCDKESGVRKVVLRGSIRNVVMAQQLIMDLVWEEMETAIGVMQFMIPDEASSRIIGRQGAFIKQLQRESGCKINTLKDTDLRSGLKARVMNVCGTNSAMSKGLYLIARKIASRWEYAPEWEGGDPTLPSGQGLPTSIVPPHAAPPPEPSAADGDSGRDGGRRQRGGRGRGGGRDRGSDLNRYERDSSRTRGGESDRRGGGGGADRSDNNARDGGGGGRYGRGGGGRDDGPSSGGRDGSKSSRSGTAPLQTTSAPWISDQPSGLPSVVGGAPAPGSAAAAAASTEAWQRLLGQIPATARESLGFGALPVPGPAADVFGQFAAGRTTVAAAAPQQLQQPPQQVSWQPPPLQQAPQISQTSATTVGNQAIFLSPGTLTSTQPRQQQQQPQQQPQQQQQYLPVQSAPAPGQEQSTSQVLYQPTISTLPSGQPQQAVYATTTTPPQQQQQQQQQQQPTAMQTQAPPQAPPGVPQAPPGYQPTPQQQLQPTTVYSTTRPPGLSTGQVVSMAPPPAQQLMIPGQQPPPQQQQQQQQQQTYRPTTQGQQQPLPSQPGSVLSSSPQDKPIQQGYQPTSQQQQQQQQQQPQSSPSLTSSSPTQSAPTSNAQQQHAPPQYMQQQQQQVPPPVDYSRPPPAQQQRQQDTARAPASATGAEGSDPSMEVRIPEASVGYVFGKGGNTIADVKSKAGVNIITDSTVDGTNSRLLHVTGKMPAIQHAITLLNDLVVKWQSLPPKRSNGGSRGGGSDRNGGGGGGGRY